MTDTEQAVNVTEQALLLGVSKDTIYNLVRVGKIPGFKVGRDWRFLPSKVQAALEKPTDMWAPPSRRKGRRAA